MAELTLALKGKPFAYAPYLVASYANLVEADSVKIDLADKALLEDGKKDSTASLQSSGSTHKDNKAILTALSQAFPKISSKQDEEWIDFALTKLSGDFKQIAPALGEMEDHLALRTYFAGYKITVADLAVWGILRSLPIASGAVRKTYVNLGRWFRYLEALPWVTSALASMTSATVAANKKTKEADKLASGKKSNVSSASFEIGLQDAEDGKVVTRFPPEPSGYLHIGHAKAAMLNQYFAQRYNGKLIIRFDDTNPTKEKQEFEDSIIQDLKLLGIKGDVLTYTSDHFQTLYDYAVQLIKQGDAYVDDTAQELMRDQRMKGEASVRRERTIEENLQLFTVEMRHASDIGKSNCLRAKMSVDNPNKAMRDPVIYRVNETTHHRTGSAWKIYPTYDFCCPLVDSIEGVTHALRTIEYRDRNPQYEWFLEKLNLRRVHIWDFARMNFIRTLLSKRKLQWFVDQGHVGGWDDPRFPTVRGVRRRGMQVDGLREFILSQGPSKNNNNLEWSAIWATNKKSIDPVAPRHTAIAGAVKVAILGRGGEPTSSPIPKHKKNPDLGTKTTWYSNEICIDLEDALTLTEGEELTLMDWGNAFVTRLIKTDGAVQELVMTLHLEGDFRKTSKKLTWLSTSPQPVAVTLVDFDHLITKEKLEEGDDVKDFMTKETEFKTEAVADVNVKELKHGEVIQFERKGYFIVDEPYESDERPIVFFNVPDGKAVSRYGAKQ
ncbi:putative glutamyl-tRNA synthetase, cytoplasmic [Protomyces lactucae-debilis]|uniref:glutamate--tRNA ligase n=1 Tax=Protomyces lactucae-debilis TaxID=2754530 RepID=A0A1Y2FAL4_PROLT|nr:putative glutamyl-tRNA synthetase, cytoplasmic [Protomyces lactucae-debilis]ORY80962.1 putative glutamyl-tRNA synthetase, cytoplasmic [Protomyces lactucae-debilis]